jgi:hypothetical protein
MCAPALAVPRLENSRGTLRRLVRVTSVRGWQSRVQGLIFGVYMFGTSLPAIAVDAARRLNGMRPGEARGTP